MLKIRVSWAAYIDYMAFYIIAQMIIMLQLTYVPVAWPTLQVASPVRPSRSTAVQLISPRQMLGVERTRMVYTPGLLKS